MLCRTTAHDRSVLTVVNDAASPCLEQYPMSRVCVPRIDAPEHEAPASKTVH